VARRGQLFPPPDSTDARLRDLDVVRPEALTRASAGQCAAHHARSAVRRSPFEAYCDEATTNTYSDLVDGRNVQGVII
jgi:hypothetical protein